MSMIDWTDLREPLTQALFKEMCSELLKRLGLEVQPAASPSDRALLLVLEQSPPIRVECCPRRARLDDGLVEELIGELMHDREIRTDEVVVFTNVTLSDTSKRLLDRINESEHYGVRVGCVEGRDLERLLVCQRAVYRKYFRGKLSIPGDLDCTEIRSPKVFCSFGASTRFQQKDTEMRLRLANAGPSPLELEIRSDGRPLRRLTVGTFGRETLSLPAVELDPENWSGLEVVPVSEASSRLIVEGELKRPPLPVDHIYVDPLDWCGQVRRSLGERRIVYLSGGPGTGKTRLLHEACDTRQRPAWIDLSQGSYGTALSELLLSQVFDLDLETVRLVHESFLFARLRELGCEELETQAVLRYVKSDEITVGKRAFSRILAGLASIAFADRVLIIDNVHRLRHLDAELLRALISNDHSGPIVFTARDQEIEDPELVALLGASSTDGRLVRLVLDSLPVSSLIESFLKRAAADDSSRRFLSVLRHSPNMQQFMLAIKSFCARGLIEQQDDGRLLVARGEEQIQVAESRELLSKMLAAIGRETQTGDLVDALECAAVFGFSFDLRFLEETLNSDADPLLALLEEKELIVAEGKGRPHQYRFDHELTHDIVYGSIPSFRRHRLHVKVIDFIEEPSRYRAGADDAELSRHYEVVQDYDKGAEHSLKNARFLLQRSGLSDGHAQYERALQLAERLRNASDTQETDARSYVLEAHALEGFIDTGAAMLGVPGMFHQVRKLDTLMKLYPADDPERERLEGRVAFYFGRHFNITNDNIKARPFIAQAIDRLREAAALSNLGEALARACTLEKNCGDWDNAVRYGREAIEVFEAAGDREGLSEAYGNLGAVFLEAGNPEETVPWWKKAVEVVAGRGRDQATCVAQVNYAYILALISPDAFEVERELHKACDLAMRLAMDSDEARARLNLANWIYFHHPAPAASTTHLERATELITHLEDSYLRLLLMFSKLNLNAASTAERREIEQEIGERACEWVEGRGGLDATGDNRIRNMVEYLAERGVARARALVHPGEQHERRSNPYRRNDRFITLY